MTQSTQKINIKIKNLAKQERWQLYANRAMWGRLHKTLCSSPHYSVTSETTFSHNNLKQGSTVYQIIISILASHNEMNMSDHALKRMKSNALLISFCWKFWWIRTTLIQRCEQMWKQCELKYYCSLEYIRNHDKYSWLSFWP